MPLSIRTGISNQTAGVSKSSNTSAIPQTPALQVGKVMGVVTTNNTPTPRQFERVGGFSAPGTIFYLDYDKSKNIDPIVGSSLDVDAFLNRCTPAKPLFPQFCYYPLLGELVYIIELPSPSSQLVPLAPEKYYINSINLWSDSQVNSQTANAKAPLGKTFIEDANVRNILNYEGDHIIQGRKGNSIRFGTTVRVASNRNEWSDIGLEGYPITIISNGHKYSKDKEFYIEQINEDASSLYLTSQQFIPLSIGNIKLSNITAPIGVIDYTGSQAIVNAGRTIISSKSDEVLVFGKTGIELYSQGPVYMQSNNTGITIQDDLIFLGPSNNNQTTQPLVLGNNLVLLLADIVQALSNFSTNIVDAKATPEGITITEIGVAAEGLQTYLSSCVKSFNNSDFLLSKKTYTL